MTPFEVHVVILNCFLGVLTSFGSHIQSSSQMPCQTAYKVTYQHRILAGFLSQFVWFLILICGLILFVSLERELAQVLRQQNSSSMSYKFLLRTSKHQQDINLLVICAQCYQWVIVLLLLGVMHKDVYVNLLLPNMTWEHTLYTRFYTDRLLT